jgi:hypothetical protein
MRHFPQNFDKLHVFTFELVVFEQGLVDFCLKSLHLRLLRLESVLQLLKPILKFFRLDLLTHRTLFVLDVSDSETVELTVCSEYVLVDFDPEV